MSQIQGLVEVIDDSKTGNGRNGPWTLYKVKVAGQWISAGFKKPSFTVGQTISFNTKPGRNGNGLDIDGPVSFVGNAPPPPPPQQQSQAPRADTRTDDRQMSIVMQHSQEMALRHVANLAGQGALALSAATGKGGVAKRQAELDAITQKYVVQFYNDAITGRLLKFVGDTLPSLKADGAIPDKKVESDDDMGGSDDN